MRGSVVKKGTRWYVKIELDPEPGTGKRHQKWHSGYNTKREAERARIDLLSKFDRGEYVEPSHQTVAEYMADWLVAITPTVRASTFESYERNVRNHIVAYIGTVRLSKVDAGVLNGMYAALLASGRRPSSLSGRGFSPAVVARAQELRADGVTLLSTASMLQTEFPEAAYITKETLASLLRRTAAAEAAGKPTRPAGLDRRTVNYIHTILHRAFKDAVRWGRLARNPADAADPPKAGQKADGIHAWDAASLRQFLDSTRTSDDRFHALWVLLATSGMRRGEALGLRWSDLDLEKGRLRVVQTVSQVRSEISFGEPKTAKGRRSIALDGATIAVLREHRKRMLEERLLVGPDFKNRGLVFHQPDGEWLHPDAVSDMFLRRALSSGLPRITLHGLRHTWATLALEKGIHPRVVQERLGHSTIAITLGIYSHVSPTLHDEAAALVADLFL